MTFERETEVGYYSPPGIYPRKWEKVSEATIRLKVPGGWLVETFQSASLNYHSVSTSVSIVFLPDPHHEWILEEKKK